MLGRSLPQWVYGSVDPINPSNASVASGTFGLASQLYVGGGAANAPVPGMWRNPIVSIVKLLRGVPRGPLQFAGGYLTGVKNFLAGHLFVLPLMYTVNRATSPQVFSYVASKKTYHADISVELVAMYLPYLVRRMDDGLLEMDSMTLQVLRDLSQTYRFVQFNVELIILGYLLRKLLEKVWNMVKPYVILALKRLLERVRHKPAVLPSRARKVFKTSRYFNEAVGHGHDHAKSAIDRNQANNFSEVVAANMGLTTWSFQQSLEDQKRGRPGSREWFWVKDVQISQRLKPVPRKGRSLITYIDVDQYVDMNEHLSNQTQPVLLYTFQPHQVAREGPDYSYTFNSSNEVIYRARGGAFFQHAVWNYSTDSLLACDFWSTTAFMVERWSTTPDREIVLLVPTGTWWGPFAWLARYLVAGLRLDRVKPYDSGFNRLVIHAPEGMRTSTSLVDGYAVANISSADDEALAITARESKYPLTMAQAMTKLPENQSGAAVVMAYHRLKAGVKASVVCPATDGLRPYSFKPGTADSEGKPGLTSFMSPFVRDAFVPLLSKANEVAAVMGRIVKVRPAELEASASMLQAIKDFEKRLIPKPGLCHPVDEEEVWDRQNRPAQRQLLEASMGVGAWRRFKAFLKREPYAGVKDPRIITTINTPDKRDYSRFTYGFESVLKRQRWYAFGLSPREISARVVAVCREADFAANTDFSRFDGHGSNLMRMIEKRILLRAFHHQYHDQLSELHAAQYGSKSVLTMGTKYDAKFARTSGSPDTSIFNSLFNAFIAFYGNILAGRDPDDAWWGLGIYGGDDGLTPDIDINRYVEAAKAVGQELTFEPVLRGEPGIKFLARIYSPGVWFGDDSSMCDLKRQLSKFHCTVNMPAHVTPVMKLREKCRGFLFSDRETPIIGEFCQRVEQLSGGHILAEAKLNFMNFWLNSFDVSEQYPNHGGSWMMDVVHKTLPEADVKGFSQWVTTRDSVEALLCPPMLLEQMPAKSDIQVEVDEQVVGSKPLIEVPELKSGKAPDEGKFLRDGKRHDKDRLGKEVGRSLPRERKSLSKRPGRCYEKDGVKMFVHKDLKEEPFEAYKARKQKAGKWVDKPPPQPSQQL
jgi:hypothetical protein